MAALDFEGNREIMTCAAAEYRLLRQVEDNIETVALARAAHARCNIDEVRTRGILNMDKMRVAAKHPSCGEVGRPCVDGERNIGDIQNRVGGGADFNRRLGCTFRKSGGLGNADCAVGARIACSVNIVCDIHGKASGGSRNGGDQGDPDVLTACPFNDCGFVFLETDHAEGARAGRGVRNGDMVLVIRFAADGAVVCSLRPETPALRQGGFVKSNDYRFFPLPDVVRRNPETYCHPVVAAV